MDILFRPGRLPPGSHLHSGHGACYCVRRGGREVDFGWRGRKTAANASPGYPGTSHTAARWRLISASLSGAASSGRAGCIERRRFAHRSFATTDTRIQRALRCRPWGQVSSGTPCATCFRRNPRGRVVLVIYSPASRRYIPAKTRPASFSRIVCMDFLRTTLK